MATHATSLWILLKITFSVDLPNFMRFRAWAVFGFFIAVYLTQELYGHASYMIMDPSKTHIFY